jgi:hydrophobe/amphiphile efflux-3 (HAE3) family protein
MSKFPRKVAIFVERRPLWLILAAVILTIIFAPGITLLQTSTGFDTLVSPDAPVFHNTSIYEEQFGGEPIAVLLTGELEAIFSTGNLAIFDEFEATFSPGYDDRVHSVLTPATILQLAAAEAIHTGQATAEMIGNPLSNQLFVQGVINSGYISPEILFQNGDRADFLMNITPMGNLKYDESLQLLQDVQGFIVENELENVSAKTVGGIEMIETISEAIGSNMKWLLGISVAVMAILLLLSFPVRWNLLSLFMVGIGALWTFGIMGYLGVPLSMATMAVLPILIGLGIDYSIQFHNRYHEEVTRVNSVSEAIVVSITRMFPAIGIALVATIIGFITLFVSEVPMVRDFGLMLAVGVFFSYIVALFLLHSIVDTEEKGIASGKPGKTVMATHKLDATFSKMVRALRLRIIIRALALVVGFAGRIVEYGLPGMARFALKRPAPILLIALMTAIAGGIVDPLLPTKSDFEDLMPQGEPVLEKVQELRKVTGYDGELRFLVQADDVTTPDVLGWMKEFQDEMMDDHSKNIVRVTSPATIISEANGGAIPEKSRIDEIFGSTSSMYTEQVLSADRSTASLSFRCGNMTMEEVHAIMEQAVENANPPPGVEIGPAGTMSLAASTIDAMLGKRFFMNSLCLGAVFVVLILVYRRLTRAIFTAIPVCLVLGWVSLSLYVMRIELNPLTAVLGVLIIGIGTEFMVLLMGRYEEEKQKNGKTPHEAMVIAISKTGRAIVTTALTTLGGFAILTASDFVLIRDFGIATTMGVLLCLISSMVVMPPLVVWWDNRVTSRLPKEIAEKV